MLNIILQATEVRNYGPYFWVAVGLVAIIFVISPIMDFFLKRKKISQKKKNIVQQPFEE